jgi:hypothetical protein
MKTPIAADEAPIPAERPSGMSDANSDSNLQHSSLVRSHISHLSAGIGASSAAIGVSKDFCIRQPRRVHHE